MERPVAHSCKNGDKSHSTAKLVEQVLISRSADLLLEKVQSLMKRVTHSAIGSEAFLF